VLFAFNDLPTMKALGLYREEAYVDNGGYQPVETRELAGAATR
jgi:gentisate 1,2-dioxygenase